MTDLDPGDPTKEERKQWPTLSTPGVPTSRQLLHSCPSKEEFWEANKVASQNFMVTVFPKATGTTALIVKKQTQRQTEPRGDKKQHLGREWGMTNSKGLDSKDEQFMLEQQPANKRTIREERGQSNRLKKLQSCLGQMTAAVPDMPCSEQLRACSAYHLSQYITPQLKHGCLDPKELRKVHSIILCSAVPDVHKIKTVSQSERYFLPGIPAFSNSKLFFYEFLFQRKRN